MGTVRDWVTSRWTGGGLALLGVLLVVPSVLSPTWEMSVADREHGSLLSRQWEWSWGRVRLTGLEGVELRDVWNPLALVVLVALLVAALVGIVGWQMGVLRRVRWGLAVGLGTIGLLTGRILTTVSARVGQSFAEVDQGASGLDVRTRMTSAGSFETAAAAVLLVALALMVSSAIQAGSTGRRPDETSPPEDSSARRPADPTGLRPVGEHVSGSPVSFDEVARAHPDPSAPTGRQGRRP